MPAQRANLNEEEARDFTIEFFYGKVFKICPEQYTEDIDNKMREKWGVSLEERGVELEGWYNIDQVYEMVEHVKRLTPVELTQFTRECPSKLLTEFILKNLRAIVRR